MGTLKGKSLKAPVKVLSKLEAEDSYDFVFLTVRGNQLHAALEEPDRGGYAHLAALSSGDGRAYCRCIL